MLSAAVGATWIVEQPQSSLLMSHDRLDELILKWLGKVPVAWLQNHYKRFISCSQIWDPHYMIVI